MTSKVALLGANGQVGTELLAVLSRNTEWEVVALTRAELDITDPNAINRVLSSISPDIVVNATAYTQVDKAESEPELAYAVNALGPRYLAQYTQSTSALLFHISTDYVFSGKQSTPYTEDDTPDPVNQYGLTKLQGERFIQASCSQYMILRTAWVFGKTGNNFVKTMLKLAQSHAEISVVNDQIGIPTYAHDIAVAIATMLSRYLRDNSLSGVYHYSGTPKVTWYEFAQTIFQRNPEYALPVTQVNAISTLQYPTPAQRPAFSLLSNDKIMRVFAVTPSQWQVGLDQLLQELSCK